MTAWADLAYEMWALICNSVHDGHGGPDAPAQWERRKAELRDRLHAALAAPVEPHTFGGSACSHVRAEDCYRPVRVPENTGKHPGESGETRTKSGSIFGPPFWRAIPLAAPVHVEAGKRYMACISLDGTAKVYEADGGPLIFPADATITDVRVPG